MKIVDLIRLLRKHLVLLIITPVILALLVSFLTRKPHFSFASDSTLYTGLATGSSVEMDKSFNFFATNTAFDNLISIIKSRDLQQEVSIRLLAQHLMMDHYDPIYISEKSFKDLKKITPPYVSRMIVKKSSSISSGLKPEGENVDNDTTSIENVEAKKDSFSFAAMSRGTYENLFPPYLDKDAYELNVAKLTNLMESSDTNFVYSLLNFVDPHYSLAAISTLKIIRYANSDMVNLHYEVDDQGICQQTVALFTEVAIRNYKKIKENRSDAVVKYFEYQLKQASIRLKIAEDKLLQFNKDNNIINYYEQSKAVAVVKEDLDVEYNNKRIKLAGVEAAIKRLEEKLGIQQKIQLKSSTLLDMKNQLGELNYKIASAETTGSGSAKDNQKLVDLKAQAEKLKDEIRNRVNEFYAYGNSIDGLPISSLLNDWISNIIEAENLKAGLQVLGDRIKEFQKQYSIYAPAGANIKRIEREISVSEQEFLEILHGLNLAKLKMQDNELSSNIKPVDPPYYPIKPIPTKRKILVIVAAFFGFLIVAISILVSEYFDNTLKNPGKAGKILKLSFLGMLPKIFLKAGKINFPFVINRLLEIAVQNMELILKNDHVEKSVKTLLFFSIYNTEGKTVVVGNLADKLIKQGKKVLVLNYSHQSLREREIEQIGRADSPLPEFVEPKTYK
ncbi:MAG: hypothetical protein WCL00_05455, partial [Bacteroidota bacterium]